MRPSQNALLAIALMMAGAAMISFPGAARAEVPEVPEAILRVPIGQANRVDCKTSQASAGGSCQKVTGDCIKGTAPYQGIYYTDAGCNNAVGCISEKGCPGVYIIPSGSILANYTKLIYGYLKLIIATLAAVMIGWGGIEWTASGGSTEAIASGKQKMLNALLGLGLFILAGLLLKTINPDMFPMG